MSYNNKKLVLTRVEWESSEVKSCSNHALLTNTPELWQKIWVSNFYDYACAITPEDWPEALRIGEHTAKNFSRQLAAEDRTEAYYDMEQNPQAKLCDKLWEIVIQAVLTEIP